jgi:hypothetical protein
MYWEDEPATEQQLVHLKNAGCVVARPLTRTEAARLIREYRKNPARALSMVTAQATALREASPPPNQPTPAPAQSDFSEGTRMHAYHLRVAAEKARQSMALNSDAPNVRADALSTSAGRREFWLDTCRDVREMRIASMHVFELYQRQGCRFFAPNPDQVQVVLEALDAAMPLWDRDHPELFYQALELNFPQLVRRM